MTATSACRIELEALRERLSAIIHELKNAERMIEAFDVPTPSAVQDAVAAVCTRAVAPTRPVKARAKAAKPNGTPAHASRGAQTATYAGGADIISALGAAREPMSPTHLIRVTKLPRWRVMKTLLLMHATGQLVKVGKNRGAKYALPSTPRPGAVAGTQAAPPVGPPSANGTKSAAAGDFDIAWSGTKERNGQAPSILPPRERRP